MSKLPFTLFSYEQMLKLALTNGYQFHSFSNCHHSENSLTCLLRHDIDVDLEAAYELAKIEANLGIKATYFLMVRSPIYNLFSRSNHKFVEQIIGLGHHIGLHYDEGFNAGERYSLEEWIQFEAQIIEQNFNTNIKVVSFHQPSRRVLNNEVNIQNFINTYDQEQLRGFQYISDSNKVWKEKHPVDIFEKKIYDKLHLLIHPMWWYTKEDKLTEEVWNDSIIRNFINAQKQVLDTERAFGTKKDFLIRNSNGK